MRFLACFVLCFVLSVFTSRTANAIGPGDAVTLANWEGSSQVSVRIESITPNPVRWQDAAGTWHTDRTISYFDLKRNTRLTTTLAWFDFHVVRQPVSVVVTEPRDLPLASVSVNAALATIGRPPAPRSNQSHKDGVLRPLDLTPSYDPDPFPTAAKPS